MRNLCIRKVHGASFMRIASLICARFLKLILIACVIAWPLGYIIMNRWLDEFAYKSAIGIMAFVLSGAVVVMIAIASISTQIVRAASADPAAVLRME